MDKNREYVSSKLSAIREKHLNYFIVNNCKILSCVTINWKKPISAHLINKLLPIDIAWDLESMFWVD